MARASSNCTEESPGSVIGTFWMTSKPSFCRTVMTQAAVVCDRLTTPRFVVTVLPARSIPCRANVLPAGASSVWSSTGISASATFVPVRLRTVRAPLNCSTGAPSSSSMPRKPLGTRSVKRFVSPGAR